MNRLSPSAVLMALAVTGGLMVLEAPSATAAESTAIVKPSAVVKAEPERCIPI